MDKLKFEEMNYHSFLTVIADDNGNYVAHKLQPGLTKAPCVDNSIRPIEISIEIHERFINQIESWRHPSGHYWAQVQGYIIGHKKGIIVDAERLDCDNQGCLSFPTYDNPIFMRAFGLLHKRGSEICGFARVSSIACTSFWSHSNGPLYWDRGGFRENPDCRFINYHPGGIECLWGSPKESLRKNVNYKLITIKRKTKIPSPVEGCIDTTTVKAAV